VPVRKQPGGGYVEQLHAAFGQHVQEVDQVELVDEGIGHLDEHVR
jgi:hypothetical protein